MSVTDINPDDAEVIAWISEMSSSVASDQLIYRPGAFWTDLIERNLDMIRADGVRNFKRTLSNNYYNWLVVSWSDPQLRKALIRWLRKPDIASWRTSMESATGLRTINRDDSFDLSPRALRRFRFFVGSAWEAARQEDALGLTDVLQEPEVGNPVRVRSRGRLISQDLANSVIECNYVARTGLVREGARIAELGAGYGRLAHAFSAAAPVVYCIFDIPPALAISQWYLREILGPERIVAFRADWDGSDFDQLQPGTVAFFTPGQLELFPDGFFDVTQTVSTLPEMPRPQAEHFLTLLAAKSRGELFLKQWQRWRNDADDVELTEADYQLPAPWQLTGRRVDPLQPLFFNQRWQRVG